MSHVFLVTEFATNAPTQEEFVKAMVGMGCKVKVAPHRGGPRKYIVITEEGQGFDAGVKFAAYIQQSVTMYTVEEFTDV